jgi:OOP family OmpA-OmpF porin
MERQENGANCMEGARFAIVALALLVLMSTAAAALAQPVSGFYLQGSAGLTLPQQRTISLPSAQPNSPETSAAAAGAAIGGKPGVADGGSLGWGFGNGLRMEMEGVSMTQGSGAAQ